MRTISELLRESRIQKGKTIREVAVEVHAGESQISNWERGINKPSVDAINRYIASGIITREQAADALLGEAA